MRSRVLIGLLTVLIAVGTSLVEAAEPRVAPGGAPPAGSGPADVHGYVRVIDGSSLDLTINGKRVAVGILGVDAPQGNTACGLEATTRLRPLVRGGVRLEEDPNLTYDARDAGCTTW